MSYDKADDKDLGCYKIPAANSEKYDTMSAYMISAGSGSAYGGEWKPAKEDDKRFLGTPGEINVMTDRNADKRETKIGDDGKAIRERHDTDHGRPDKHSNPHDRIIIWDERGPHPGSPINYPDGAPEFKKYGGLFMEGRIIPCNSLEEKLL